MSIARKFVPPVALALGATALMAVPSSAVTPATGSCNGNTGLAPVPIANNPDPATYQAFGSPGVTAHWDSSTSQVVISGTAGPDVVVGTNGNDRITTDGGNDTVCARKGDDYVDTGADDDYAAGGQGADLVIGDGGNDNLNGVSGNDTVFGGNGNDTVHGGGGNDYVRGDAGDDQVFGDSGADTLNGDNAAPANPAGTADSCDGGMGTDTQEGTNCETTTNIP